MNSRIDSGQWSPQLVAVDLDGTTVKFTGKHEIPSVVVTQALRSVVAAGVHVVIATGRSVGWARNTLDDLDFPSGPGQVYIAAANGSLIFSPQTRQIVSTHVFDPEPVTRWARSWATQMHLLVECELAGVYTTASFLKIFPFTVVREQDYEQLIMNQCYRIGCYFPDHDNDSVKELIDESHIFSDYSWTFPIPSFLDVMKLNVTKTSAVAEIAASCNVEAFNVLAVGDADNDIPLMQWAGRSAAMGNSSLEVKDIATEVIGSVDDDGLAYLLRRWF